MQDETQNVNRAAGEDVGIPDPAATVGTPEEDIGTWDGKQGYNDTCAIRCQEFILEQFTGQEVSEDALVQQAEAAGWYAPGVGTYPENVGNLLEANGVPINRYEEASAVDLANELAQGHKVVVAIDSGELWDQGLVNGVLEWVFDYGQEMDHAVVVSGIDTTDPNNPQVIVSDPGTGEPAATYPMDQFVGAWQDSNFQMVATAQPAPPTMPEMVNFDYEEGHIPEVMGVPYDDFVNDPSMLYDRLPNPEEPVAALDPDPPDDAAAVQDLPLAPDVENWDDGTNAPGDYDGDY